jgi:hypothetical protein
MRHVLKTERCRMKSKHVFFLGIAVGLLTAIALAGGATAEETKNVTGTVKTASDDSLTITVDEKDWTFVVDKDTKVVAKDAEMMGGKGAEMMGGKDAEMMGGKDAEMMGGKGAEMMGGKTKFTDLVKAKQKVTVSYHETEDKLHAAEVRIL